MLTVIKNRFLFSFFNPQVRRRIVQLLLFASSASQAAGGFGQSQDQRCFQTKEKFSQHALVQSQKDLPTTIKASPILLGDQRTILVAGENGTLYFLDLDLNEIGKLELSGEIVNTPHVVSNRSYSKWKNHIVLAVNGTEATKDSPAKPARIVAVNSFSRSVVLESNLSYENVSSSITESGDGFVLTSCRRKASRDFRVTEASAGTTNAATATMITAQCAVHVRDLDSLEETVKPGAKPGKGEPWKLPEGADVTSSPVIDSGGLIYVATKFHSQKMKCPKNTTELTTDRSTLHVYSTERKAQYGFLTSMGGIEGVPLLLAQSKSGSQIIVAGTLNRMGLPPNAQECGVEVGFGNTLNIYTRPAGNQLKLVHSIQFPENTRGFISSPVLTAGNYIALATRNGKIAGIPKHLIVELVDASEASDNMSLLWWIAPVKAITDAWVFEKIASNPIEASFSETGKEELVIASEGGEIIFLDKKLNITATYTEKELGGSYGFPLILSDDSALIAFKKGGLRTVKVQTSKDGIERKVAPCETAAKPAITPAVPVKGTPIKEPSSKKTAHSKAQPSPKKDSGQ